MKIGPLKCEEFIVVCGQCGLFADCNPVIVQDADYEKHTFITAKVYRFQNRIYDDKMHYECLYYIPSASKLLSDFAQDVIDYLKRIDAKLETMVSTNGK